MFKRYFIQFFFIFLNVYLLAAPTKAQNTPTLIDSLQKDIEEIRGKKFKHSVRVDNQSLEDFGKYLDKMLDKQFSNEYGKQYGKVVRKLGLYRGPQIKDFKAMAKMVMQSQAAAYYDPAKKTFFVVMQSLPSSVMSAVYAHELYHGFQDQYYDLDRFVLSQMDEKLNDDELLARQSLVEGEATYIMTLWTFKKQFGSIPDRSLLQMAVNMQAQLDVKKILEMVRGNALPIAQEGDMKNAIKAMEDIPPFLIETLIGAYLKGMAFVFQIQEEGWKKIDELYNRPPASSEHILHPEKWVAGEYPYTFTWPAFDRALFSNWKLLESNTIGEIQWRIIFNEHEMAEAGLTAAQGWDGDSFAVLENTENGKLLLLMYTSWDTHSDAVQFSEAYTKLLKVKYENSPEYFEVESKGRDVLVIEGGNQTLSPALLGFLNKLRKSKKKA